MSWRERTAIKRAADAAVQFLARQGAADVKYGCCLKVETGWVVRLSAGGQCLLLHVDPQLRVSQ